MIRRGHWQRSCLLLLGCLLGVSSTALAANTYQMHEAPYVAPDAPGPDETLVYVLRENTGMGALQKLAIIDNDTVVGVLTPGTFTWFRVPSGQHEIVGYISPSPMMHYRVQPAPGKTVYLLCKIGYASGLFVEPMDETAAAQLMTKFKYTEIALKGQKAKMDYRVYYDNLYR